MNPDLTGFGNNFELKEEINVEDQISAAQKLINTLIEFFVNYSFQVVGAVIILVVGYVLASWTSALVFKLSTSRKIDIPLARFFALFAKTLILIFAIIVALGKFGIAITPFIAALGAVAFGATYAIQGPLSNYGAGLSIILGRTFGIGDTITVVGVSGVVEDIKLACTILTTEDGVKITIPNKHIVGEILQNSKGNRIVEGVIGISYDSDPERAIKVIKDTLMEFSEVQKDTPFQIGIQQFGDSAINIAYRYWVPTTKYFQTSSAVNLEILKGMQDVGINIPFPQREIRIVSQPSTVKSLS